MEESLIAAILAALKAGERVELLRKDGNIIAQTVRRKRIKQNHEPTA